MYTRFNFHREHQSKQKVLQIVVLFLIICDYVKFYMIQMYMKLITITDKDLREKHLVLETNMCKYNTVVGLSKILPSIKFLRNLDYKMKSQNN